MTFYEVVGWLGVIERDGGSPLPQLFPSVAGGVHPLYHPLADVLEFAGGEAVPTVSSAPLTAGALVLRKDGRLRVLATNTTPFPQTLTLEGVQGVFAVRALDETTADRALRDPAAFRASAAESVKAGPDGLRLTLRPFATLCCDVSSIKESKAS